MSPEADRAVDPGPLAGSRLGHRAQNTLFLCAALFAGTLTFFFVDLYKFYYGALALILVYLTYVGAISGKRFRLAYCVPVVWLCAYFWVSLLWSADFNFGLYQVAVGTAFFLFAWLPPLSASVTDDFKFRLLQAATGAYCVAETVTYATTGSSVNPLDLRFRGLVGEIFLIAIPALVYLYATQRSRFSLLLLIMVGAIALVLNDRSLLVWGPFVLLAAIAIAGSDGKKSSARLRRRLGVAILAVPLIALLSVQIYYSDAYSRVRNETSSHIGRQVLREQFNTQSSVDIERRINTFVALQMFLDHPVFGAGFGSTAYYVHRVSRFKTVAHGLPLMLLAETGIVGTALFAGVLISSLLGYWSKIKAEADRGGKNKVLFEVLTLVAVLLAGLTTQVYFNIYLWIFLGTGLYYRGQLRKTKTTTNGLISR